MKTQIPQRIAAAGGIFIILSGALNFVLGIQIDALYYYPYPGGKMGHVGIIAGLIAVLIGALILFLSPACTTGKKRNCGSWAPSSQWYSVTWEVYLAPFTLAQWE